MGLEKTVGKNLVAGVDNVMFEVRGNTSAKVALLYISNASGNNKSVAVKWFDASTNETYYIVNNFELDAYKFLKLDGSYIKLDAGDKLICTPEAASTMSSIVTYEETEK
jgi:hypothetical protein